jgi:predicted RNA-binding protein with PUA domain
MQKQRVTITRAGAASGGTTDPDTGEFTPGSIGASTIWTGRGIYLDQGPQDRFNKMGVAEYDANGSVYLPKGVIESSGVAEGDSVSIVYQNGDAVDAEVAKVIRFKHRIDVRRA